MQIEKCDFRFIPFSNDLSRWKMAAHSCAAEPLNLFRGSLDKG